MAEEEETKKPSMLSNVMIAGFIALVVIVETCLFFFVVPSADDVAALAEKRLIKQVEADMAEDGEEVLEEDEDKIVEFNLEDYGLSFSPPGSDRNYTVEFSLKGTVRSKEFDKLEALYQERRGRFRDRILREIRSATVDELNENELGLLRRRILATSNEVFEEPILLGVLFPSYQVYED